jgi:hypothetical protein
MCTKDSLLVSIVFGGFFFGIYMVLYTIIFADISSVILKLSYINFNSLIDIIDEWNDDFIGDIYLVEAN